MPKGYPHLTHDQRCKIYTSKVMEKSLTEIASIIGVFNSLIKSVHISAIPAENQELQKLVKIKIT